MWVSKHRIEVLLRINDDLQRRVKRLELMLLKDAQDKIASLRDEDAGSVSNTGILTIEEIINK